MPTPSTYYLNGPSLGSATAVFSDAAMTTCAADGFYSDGVITRQQVSCSLLPQQACPICGDPCEGNIVNLESFEGVYYISFDAGTTIYDTGAIIITMELDNSVSGIRVFVDGVLYNTLSSPVYGLLAGSPSTAFTYIGGTAYDCGIDGSTYTLDEYSFTKPSYTPLGTTTSVSITSGEDRTTANDPGLCVMVIPKPTTTPNIIDVTVIGPCPSSKALVSISCPIALPSFLGTFGTTTILPAVFCNLTYSYTYYVAPVGGDGITLGLYDWVFSDANGVNVLADGFYRSPAIPIGFDTFEVADGIIVNFTTNCAL
jgi:hypothetical protein